MTMPDATHSRTGRPAVRASDADRDQVIEQLRAAAGEGRLDAAELEERVGAALAARTAPELQALSADLPSPAREPRSRRAPQRVGSRLQAYIGVMTLLVAIWALTGAEYFWPVWPALGWGIGLMSPGACSHRHRGRAQHTVG